MKNSFPMDIGGDGQLVNDLMFVLNWVDICVYYEVKAYI